MSTVKVSSRFIPTLTEVVHTASEAVSEPSKDLVDEVMRAMLPLVEAQLRASLQASIETQVREAVSLLQEPMQRAIQDAMNKKR